MTPHTSDTNPRAIAVNDAPAAETDDGRPVVSIVLLSYDRPGLLSAALDSLLAQTYARLEIIVVDNPSPQSEEVARAVGRCAGARLIRNAHNLGYTGGMNTGLRAAAGRYTLLTEDDIVLDADCVRHLVEYAEGDPEMGLAAPLILNRAEGTIRCAGGERTLGGVYRMKIYGEGERDRGQFPRPFDVGYVDGAVVFARADFLRGLGGFREEFFMYGESVELCERVAKAGARMTVVPGAKVRHFEPPPRANSSPEFSFHRYKNLFSLYLLHARARHLPEFFARYALLGLLRALAGRGGDARALLRALRWTARRTPSLLGERRRGVTQGRALTAETRGV
jgi:GT2 family glycosyltransferase